VRAVVERAGIEPEAVEDVIMGAAVQQGTQAYNIGRLCAYTGGLPPSVPGMALDRMCASGLMSISVAAKGIMAGEMAIAIAGGVESLSLTQTKHKNTYRAQSEAVIECMPSAYIPMIETAEIVSLRYGISRAAQDEYALQRTVPPGDMKRCWSIATSATGRARVSRTCRRSNRYGMAAS